MAAEVVWLMRAHRRCLFPIGASAYRPPGAMAFAPPPFSIPSGVAASTGAPRRCLRGPWRRPPLPTRPAAPRAGLVASAAVSRTEPPPAVVLLPGMDGTALLGGPFRSALDPLVSLVVRLAGSFVSGPSLQQRSRDGYGVPFLPPSFHVFSCGGILLGC